LNFDVPPGDQATRLTVYAEQVKFSNPVFDTPDSEEAFAIEPFFNKTLCEKRHFLTPVR
jgi:hypothetical protein